MARGRGRGKASDKRKRTAKKVRAKRVASAQVKRRATENAASNRENARRNQYKGNADIRTGGSSTGREKGIMASQKANKIKGLEQSVGSLDRRIQTALDKGDTNTAKDLRSRLNKFTTDLGYARAIEGNGVARSSSGKIMRTSSGNPMMTSSGRNIFDETKDQDFSDPTRKLQNTGGDAYGKMYPIQSAIQKGLPTINAIKSFLGAEDRDIPYNLQDMPGVRYPLDMNYGANEEDPFFGGRSRDPNYRQDSFNAPIEEVTISDLVSTKPSGADEILKSQGIDENFIYPSGEVGNTALQLGYDDLVQAELMKNLDPGFTKLDNPFFFDDEKKAELNAEAISNQTALTPKQIQNLEDKGVSRHFDHLYPNTPLTDQTLNSTVLSPSDSANFETEAANIQRVLMGKGYNLDEQTITDLYKNKFLDANTNYFPNAGVDTNPLIDQALASYYDSIKNPPVESNQGFDGRDLFFPQARQLYDFVSPYIFNKK
tara:strand:+ start:756 stop:2213 length:1458 start_codon:yes stop_codon:yes gene_type:complete